MDWGQGARVQAAVTRTPCRPKEVGKPSGAKRTQARQFNGHSIGAMDVGRRARRGSSGGSTHILPPSREARRESRVEHARQFNGYSIGAMDERSGKIRKASTHPGGGILVDVAVGESDIAASNAQASSLR